MIYILDEDFQLASQALDDYSLDRQIRDISKIIYCCLKKNSDKKINPILKKWVYWASNYERHYLYLVSLGKVCCSEYLYRHQIKHKFLSTIELGFNELPKFPHFGKDYYSNKIEITDIDSRGFCTIKQTFKDGSIDNNICYIYTLIDHIYAPVATRSFDLKSPKSDIIDRSREYYQFILQRRLDRKRKNNIVPIWTLWTKREKPNWLNL